MILYQSTRGAKKRYSFSEVILKGIADDGGLFVPEKIPQLTRDELRLLINESYQKRASFILNKFEVDFPEEIIDRIVNQAYSQNFDDLRIAPSVHLKENQYLLELWHGPTAAFKDMALQIKPLFFQEAIKRNQKLVHYLILVATSGDTGSAALKGYQDRKNISLLAFYPKDRISDIQELQMTSQEGANVGVFAARGDFDAVQKMVRDIFNDKDFNDLLRNQYNTELSSANSINWGRLIPQIVYHVSGYLDLVKQSVIKLGQEIDIAVPTGNFGSILAAFYAKQMGLPIRRLICASNENNAITEFLSTGVYDITSRKLVSTLSPAMDILVASNIERLLYAISQDSKKVSEWMNQLKSQGKFEVDPQTYVILRREFYADWVSNEDCLKNIKERFEETEYLIDPHTSVAQTVVERYVQKVIPGLPVVICSTAHWAKFAGDIYRALTEKNKSGKNELELLNEINKLNPNPAVPKSLSNLNSKKILHTGACDTDLENVKKLITKWVEEKEYLKKISV